MPSTVASKCFSGGHQLKLPNFQTLSRATDKCFVKATIDLAAFIIMAHSCNTWATFANYAYTIKITQ